MSQIQFNEPEAQVVVAVLGLAFTLGVKAKVFSIRGRGPHYLDATIDHKGKMKVLNIFGVQAQYDNLETFRKIHGV